MILKYASIRNNRQFGDLFLNKWPHYWHKNFDINKDWWYKCDKIELQCIVTILDEILTYCLPNVWCGTLLQVGIINLNTNVFYVINQAFDHLP